MSAVLAYGLHVYPIAGADLFVDGQPVSTFGTQTLFAGNDLWVVAAWSMKSNSYVLNVEWRSLEERARMDQWASKVRASLNYLGFPPALDDPGWLLFSPTP